MESFKSVSPGECVPGGAPPRVFPGMVVSSEELEYAAFVDATGQDIPPPPPTMELWCVCGERNTVSSRSYNRNLYCSYCDVLLHVRVGYDVRYDAFLLMARVLASPRESTP